MTLFLSYGSDPTLPCNSTGLTPVMMSIVKRFQYCTTILLANAGMTSMVFDYNGKDEMMHAIECRDYDTVTRLIALKMPCNTT